MQGLLVKYGEIALKGRNRHIFENKLIESISSNISKEYKVKKEQGRILIHKDGKIDYDKLIPIVKNTIGVTYVCPCDIIQDQKIDNLKQAVENFLINNYKNNFIFKIETKRSNKSYPLNSLEISTIIGEHILNKIKGTAVNVVNPEITVNVELRNNAYVFSKIIKGIGGLPTVSGKVLCLLSGGIDSPVATFLTARRGVEVSAVYFHSSPYTTEHARQKVIDLCKRIKTFTGDITLYIVNFTQLQLFLYNKLPQDKLTIFLKRTMVRISAKLAKNINAQALVMGDSIGQVASQTIHSIAAIDAVSNGMPIIRPLATFDKQQIIDIAQEIETYPISILPYEDCCTIFVAKHPVTKPNIKVLEKMEEKIFNELNSHIESTLNDIEIISV